VECYSDRTFEIKKRKRKQSEDTKGVTKNPTIEGQTTQWLKEKGQTTIHKALHRKLQGRLSNLQIR
jgi:hypothetical protein